MDLLESRVKALDIRSPIQKKTIEILYGLKGYSKRLDLLTSQLKIELRRENIGPTRISQQIQELIDLGLAKEVIADKGSRLALNRNIWDLDPRVISFVIKVTEDIASDMRTDSQYNGVLRRIRTTIKRSEAVPVTLSNNDFDILVRCALRRHADWELVDGQITRRGMARVATQTISQVELPFFNNRPSSKRPDSPTTTTNTDNSTTNQVEISTKRSKQEEFFLPRDIAIDSVNIDTIIPKAILEIFGVSTISFFDKVATIDIPLSLGRGQRVYITIRRNADHERLFWLYSICGKTSSIKQNISQVFWNNNECNSFKVTILEVNNIEYIGVCTSIDTDPLWEQNLPIAIRNLAVFSDRLEEMYWSQDEF